MLLREHIAIDIYFVTDILAVCGFGGFGWFWHGCGAPDLEKFGGGRAFFNEFEQLGGERR